MAKIGLFGGTFDPVHNGHIYLAQVAMEEACLSRVIFIPLNIPPHKSQIYSDNESRLHMLKLALSHNSGFFVSTIEMDRPNTTYTIDTLIEIKSIYPNDDLFYIIGSDILYDLHLWKDFHKIFSYCSFICVLRPGFDFDYFNEFTNLLPYKDKFTLIKANAKDISSHMIRDYIKADKSIYPFVPPLVADYIYENQLYL